MKLLGSLVSLVLGAAVYGHQQVKYSERSLRIYRVVAEGKTDELEKMLDNGLDPNERFEDGATLLHWIAQEWRAPREKKTQTAELLIRRGAMIDAQKPDGTTPLMVAAASFAPEVAEVLLEAGGDPNLKDNDGSAAVHHCVNWTQYDFVISTQEPGCAAVLSKLANHGADLDIRDKHGRTALMWAFGWRHLPSQRLLLLRGADIDAKAPQGRTALTWCANDGRDSETVKNLIEAGAKVRFLDALLFQDLDLALKLVDEPGTAQAAGPRDDPALLLAAELGSEELVTKLLQKGADVKAKDEQGFTAMHLTVGLRPRVGQIGRSWTNGRESVVRDRIVRLLALHGADPNAVAGRPDGYGFFEEETPLVWAAKHNLVSIAKALLDCGADPHGRRRRDSADDTVPLLAAAKRGSLEVMQLLLDAGADPDHGNPLGELYSLPWDSRGMQEPSPRLRSRQVQILLKAGANPNGTGWTGSLEAAISHNNVEAVRLLLEARAYPGGFSPVNGETELMQAVRSKNRAIVKLLLDHGADPLVRSPRGFTAGWLARSKGMKEIGRMLTEAEANARSKERKA